MRLVDEQPGGASVGGVADKDLARLCGLLEPRRDVHRITQHSELALPIADRPGDRDPGVQADPQGQPPAGPLGDRGVRPLERGDDAERRALRLLGVVDRDRADRTEDRDDRVADVLLDEPTVRPDLVGDDVPGRAHILMELGRSEPLGERRKARDVCKEHGDLTGLAGPAVRLGDQPGTARAAVVEAGRHVRGAPRAGEREGDAALTAEPHALGVPVAAGSTQHGWLEGSTRWRR